MVEKAALAIEQSSPSLLKPSISLKIFSYEMGCSALCGGTTSPQFRQYKLLGVTHQTAELESGPVAGTWEKSQRPPSSVREPTYQKIYLRVK